MTTVNKAHNDPSEDAHMQSDVEMDAVMTSDVAQDISRILAITAPAVDSAPEFFATILGYMINPTHILAALIIYILANVWKHWAFCVESLRKWNLANCPSPTARNTCALILSDKLKKLENTDNHQNEEEASSLYIATALLLKERIINIDNIYMELSPNREYELEAESAKWKSDMRKKADVISMAAMAGEEAHAMEETVMQDIAEVPMDVTRPNQKVELLTACLAIGEIETALVLLARMPKVTATRPTLTDSICSTVRTMIQCLYDSNSPEDASVPYTPCQHRASCSLALSPTEHHADLLQIVRDSELPRCCSLDGFTFQVKPLLEHVGARIFRDPKLVGMLCQIGASALYRLSAAVQDIEAIIKVMDGQYDSEMKSRFDDAKAEYSRVEAVWGEMACRFFLPAITLTRSDAELVASVCCLLQYVSRDVRIRSYRRWQRLGVREPELMVAFAQIQTEAMSILRRIDTENISIPGSKMASLVLSSPQVVVAAVVDQIEKSNKIKTIVRVFRYFTDFGYELFDFALVEYLAKSSKPKFHADGTPAKWMKDLAAFCAQLYRECPGAQVEFVLRHIIERLRKNDPSELVVLKALLCSMGGVYETSCVDVVKMAGGVSLRDKAGSKGIVSKELKSSQRLRAVMIHNNLGAHLLVALAGCCRKLQDNRQTPQAVQNRFTGIIADQAYAIKLQLVEYLGANLQHEFSRLFPSLPNLCSVHNIEAGMVLTLLRPRLQAVLYQSPMTLVSRASHGLARSEATTATMQGEKVWRKCLEPVAQDISAMLPPETWTRMAPQFVVTFWQLSLYDVFVPEDQYRAEIKKVINTVIILDSRYSDRDHQESGVSDIERNDLLQGASRLRLEMEAQLENKKRVMDRLNSEKNHWFLDLSTNSHETMHLVVQHCVAARARISAVDALYCAKFVALLHTLTPEIWGISFYNKMFEQLKEIVPNATAIEARSYGYFLSQILTDLAKLCEDTLLETEEDILDYATFQNGLHEWFRALFEACESVIATGIFIPVRNANLILCELSSCYETIRNVSEVLFLQEEDVVLDGIIDDLKPKFGHYIHATSKILGASNTTFNNLTTKETGKRGTTKVQSQILSSGSTPVKKSGDSASSAMEHSRGSGTGLTLKPIHRQSSGKRDQTFFNILPQPHKSTKSTSSTARPELRANHHHGAGEHDEGGTSTSASSTAIHNHVDYPREQSQKGPQASNHIPTQGGESNRDNYINQETNREAPSLDHVPARSTGTNSCKRAGDYLDRSESIGATPEASKKLRVGDIDHEEFHCRNQLQVSLGGLELNDTHKMTAAQAKSANSMKLPMDTPSVGKDHADSTSGSAITKSGDAIKYAKDKSVITSTFTSAIISQDPKEHKEDIPQDAGHNDQLPEIGGQGSRKRSHYSMAHGDLTELTAQEGRFSHWADSIESWNGSVEDICPKSKKVQWAETLEEWDLEQPRVMGVPSMPDDYSSNTSTSIRGRTSSDSPLMLVTKQSPKPILKQPIKSAIKLSHGSNHSVHRYHMAELNNQDGNMSDLIWQDGIRGKDQPSTSSSTSSSDLMPVHYRQSPPAGLVDSQHPQEQVLHEINGNKPSKRPRVYDGPSKTRTKKAIKLNRAPVSIVL